MTRIKPTSRWAPSAAGWGQDAMPSDHRTVAGLRQLLSEAGELCRHAKERFLEEPEKIAIQHLYGQVTAGAKIAFDFRGSLARRVRNWLRRAEQTVKTAKTNADIVGNPDSAELLNQRRDLRALPEPPHMGRLSLGD